MILDDNKKQAWSETASKWMGRWSILHNSMPDSNWPELCVQLHHCWTKRNLILACSLFMVKSHSLWTPNPPT